MRTSRVTGEIVLEIEFIQKGKTGQKVPACFGMFIAFPLLWQVLTPFVYSMHFQSFFLSYFFRCCILGGGLFFVISSCRTFPVSGNAGTQIAKLTVKNDGTKLQGQIKINEIGETEILDTKGNRINSFCARLRIDGSYELHEYSKKYLANYFRTRSLRELFIAWYFSEDSKFLALSIRRCPDKRNMHFYALKTLLRKNNIIQDLIIVNMREKEYADLAEIYIDEYYNLFPKDIK